MKKILSAILLFLLCLSSAEAQNGHFSQARFHQPITASPGDADSAAYINAVVAAGYTPSSTEKTAIGRRISDYKGRANGSYATSDIWTSVIKAVYPMLGSTAATHAINLRNPSAYTITWNGTITHTNGYYQGNGTSGYGNTGLNPNGILSSGQATMVAYVKALGSGHGDCAEIGVSNGTNSSLLIVSKDLAEAYAQVTDGFNTAYFGGTVATGIYIATAPSSSSLTLYLGNSSIASNTSTRATAQPNFVIYIGAINTSGSAGNYSNNTIGDIEISDGATSTQTTLMYNSLNAYNTALGK
jgi:hypothetical protein